MVHSVTQIVEDMIASGREVPLHLEEMALREYLADQPDSFALVRSLVSVLLRQNKSPLPPRTNVLKECSDETARSVDTIQQLVRVAEDDSKQGDGISAYARFWEAVRQHPETAFAWAQFANFLAHRNEFASAIEAAEVAVDMNVNSLESLETLAPAIALTIEQGMPCRERVINHVLTQAKWGRSVGLDTAIALIRRHRLIPMDWLATATDLVSRAPNCAPALLSASKLAFAAQQYDMTMSYFEAAVKTDPVWSVREAIRTCSRAISHSLLKTDRAEGFAASLESLHEAHPLMNLVPPGHTPEIESQTLRQRELALDRGLPSALLVTQVKSGSVSVGAIFHHGLGLPTLLYSLVNVRVIPSWAKDFARGGGCYVTHLCASPTNVAVLADSGLKRVIVHIRDPRQVIVSMMHHRLRYPAQEPEDFAVSYGEAEEANRIEMLLEDYAYIQAIIGWLKEWLDARKYLDVQFTTFEEYVADPEMFAEEILELWGGDTRYFNAAAAFTRQSNIDYHRRRGSIDEWREVLTDAQIQHINGMLPAEVWNEFGWSD